MSAYRTATDQTAETIVRRARRFRNQVVIVVAMSAITLIAAVVARSGSVLWSLLLLVPACGLFFFADLRAVNEWRSRLLSSWVARDIDCTALVQAIRANAVLPTGTVEGMLKTLPSAGDLAAEQRIATPTRQAVAAAILATHRARAYALLLNVIASAVVAVAVMATAWTRTWVPLCGVVILALLPVARALRGRALRGRLEAELATCRAQSGFSESDYARMRGGIR